MSASRFGTSKHIFLGCLVFACAQVTNVAPSFAQWHPIQTRGPVETSSLAREREPQRIQPSNVRPLQLQGGLEQPGFEQPGFEQPNGAPRRAQATQALQLLPRAGSSSSGVQILQPRIVNASRIGATRRVAQTGPNRLRNPAPPASPVVQAAFFEQVNSAQPSITTSSRSPRNNPTRLASATESSASQESLLPNPFGRSEGAQNAANANQIEVALSGNLADSDLVQPAANGGNKIDVNALHGADIRTVLSQIADASDWDLVVGDDVDATVTTNLTNVEPLEALDAILKINQLVWIREDNIIFVTKPMGASNADTPTRTTMPGQQLQVFDLHYTSVDEVLTVVNGLLSQAGKAFAHKADISSTRQTRERIVVEDYPSRLEAVAKYLASVDNPPRQVLIEASVLQVTLDSNHRHGVNLLGIARLAGAQLDVQTQGFANNQSPGFMMGLNGTDLDGMVETLQRSSTVETLAAPKVLCVNGQQARIQIGSKFGYFVTTTTQTSTLQNVDFLDIGVVLQVQPTITHDGQVLLTVEPKVSGGRINPDTGLPEEDTTEATTTVLLPDGKGMIIGGLIKELDDHQDAWVPLIGRIPLVGKLFSRRNDEMERVEVIIALTTHVVPYGTTVNDREYQQYTRATQATATEDNYAGVAWTQEYLVPEATVPPETARVPVSENGLIRVSEGGTRMQFRN